MAAQCKVSVRVGLGNEPRDLRTPFLSMNPPCVACLDPVCVLMIHVMPSLRHQLARQDSPLLLASPPASLPLSSIALFIPPRPCPQDAAFKSPLASPQVFCRRRAPSLVCATSAHSSNTCQTVTLCMTSSMRRSRTVIVGRILTGIGFIWPVAFTFSYVSLVFNFVLDSRYSPLVVPYHLRHRTPSTTARFDFAPTVAPLTCHLFAIFI